MKAIGLLLLCSVAWLLPGAAGRPLACKARRPADRGISVAAEIGRPSGRLPLGVPAGEDLSAFLGDEEDSSDGDPGDVLDTGQHLGVPGGADQAALALFALSQGSAVWTSCQRRPLRC